MKLVNKRWLILAASCTINLCIGSLYTWSVFASPMAVYLSKLLGVELTSGSLAIVFTIANAVGPITMISGGRINDKLGPRKVILLGGAMFGIGMFISGFAKSVGNLIFSYGILVGLGMGLVYGCTISNSIKFFPDKRGFAGGITTATYGLSSVLIPPVANRLINSIGVLDVFRLLGIVFGVVICSLSFLIEKCPENYIPEGWVPSTGSINTSVKREKNWKEMISSPIFYVMMLMLTCGAFYGLMCISQASSIAQNMIGMSAASAATAVSILALFNSAGRIGAGYISDRIGRINTLSTVFILAVVGLGLLYFSGQSDERSFYAGISITGICFGAFMGVFPGFTADKFGAKNNGVNYGIMFIGFALAGIFGPMIMSRVYATDGNYQRAFLIAAGLAVSGLLLSSIYRKMEKNEELI